MYGTHTELSEQNFDTTQLLGLIRKKKERDEFSYKDEDSEEEEEEEDGVEGGREGRGEGRGGREGGEGRGGEGG